MFPQYRKLILVHVKLTLIVNEIHIVFADVYGKTRFRQLIKIILYLGRRRFFEKMTLQSYSIYQASAL